MGQSRWSRKFIERLSNPESYAKIKEEIIFNILNDRGGEDLNRIQFARVKWQPELEGKTLKDWIAMDENLPLKMEQSMSLKDSAMSGA